ncbi:hypothetical protein BLA24_05410 [Streptomyces cinnamoneus]|uniref:Uncharacterized protein n=1 Tax=Streptomyces cinnamoneus TaxID=53446 RepID=A0A2G1XNC5_STRCJ|nr:hypothetical protein [Streptomyces cinnamoneus]PHQ52713.1 hypothetical protein BLA24_05410 [Streptomyces cinnamoneus]PPT11807.1 hypothetical protein CYQ11_01870 [Streptomyces cinnamoneus]
MIVLQPVLEIQSRDGFALWPVAALEPYTFLPLSGALSQAEVGTAVMSIAACNDMDPEGDDGPLSQRATDPLGAFLHGLLTMDPLFASGGLRMTDTATGVTLLPGCCNGLEERGDWGEVLDGDGWASFGHDPSPVAERLGGTVRLTVDAEQDDSPVIETTVTGLRPLLAGVERDLTDFLRLVDAWAARHLPDHAVPVTTALVRALAPPAPGAADGSAQEHGKEKAQT